MEAVAVVGPPHCLAAGYPSVPAPSPPGPSHYSLVVGRGKA